MPATARSLRVALSLALALLCLPRPAPTDPVKGAWEGPFCWPNLGTHMVHLHTGKFLIWPGHFDDSDYIEAWLWDPKPGCFGDNPRGGHDPDCFKRVDNEQTNLFCSGHAALADGTILVTGGHRGQTGANRGLVDANLFFPETETWSGAEEGVAKMKYRRWYPTATTLPDGRVLVVSGSDSLCDAGPNEGEQCVQPCPDGTCSNDSVCMGGGRDGLGCDCQGGNCLVGVIARKPEVYDPKGGTWTELPGADLAMPFYPLMFVLPDGRVFYAGVEDDYDAPVSPLTNYALDVATETWSLIDVSTTPGASGVSYQPGKVLKAGGNLDPAHAVTQLIDFTPGGGGSWQTVGAMKSARVRANLTLLPDGTVVATGGSRYGNWEYRRFCDGGERNDEECRIPDTPPGDPDKDCPPGHGSAPADDCPGSNMCTKGDGAQMWVADVELIDPQAHDPLNPQNTKWTEMAPMKTPRMYHSTAVLLRDGRVVVAGGGQGGRAIANYSTMELFSPPYLFKGPRPSVSAAPDTIRYGDVFDVVTPDAASVAGVTLVRLAAATHGFDHNQRFLSLAFKDLGGRVEVEAPAGPTLAPPGYYMLFLVNQAGVPSIARYVRVRTPTVVWVDFAHAGVEEGTFNLPFNTLVEGVAAVNPGGAIRIKKGETSDKDPLLEKPMTIESYAGSAVVGN